MCSGPALAYYGMVKRKIYHHEAIEMQMCVLI